MYEASKAAHVRQESNKAAKAEVAKAEQFSGNVDNREQGLNGYGVGGNPKDKQAKPRPNQSEAMPEVKYIPPVADATKNVTADPLQPMAVFKGTREHTVGPSKQLKGDAEIRIKTRDGNKFTATAIYGQGRNRFDVSGTLNGGDVAWTEIAQPGSGGFPTTVVGVLMDGTLILGFKGNNPLSNAVVEGKMKLMLEVAGK